MFPHGESWASHVVREGAEGGAKGMKKAHSGLGCGPLLATGEDGYGNEAQGEEQDASDRGHSQGLE